MKQVESFVLIIYFCLIIWGQNLTERRKDTLLIQQLVNVVIATEVKKGKRVDLINCMNKSHKSELSKTNCIHKRGLAPFY